VDDEHRYREIFVPDSGSLLDIYVFDVTKYEWQSVLNFLAANYELHYTEDGVAEPLPPFTTIRLHQQKRATSLKIQLCGFTVNTHFFLDDQIEMDVRPEDIDSLEKAQAVFMLIKCVTRLLEKEVFMVAESSLGSEELKQMAVCSCNPADLEIRLGPGAGDQK
jgi:hypothetical protein